MSKEKSKISKIGDGITPNFLLSSALEQVVKIDKIFIVALRNDDSVVVGYSDMDLADLCLLKSIANKTVDEILSENDL